MSIDDETARKIAEDACKGAPGSRRREVYKPLEWEGSADDGLLKASLNHEYFIVQRFKVESST